MAEPDLNILALHLLSGLGVVTYRRLLARFGSPEAVIKAPMDKLAGVPGLGPKRLESMVRMRRQAEAAAAEELKKAHELGVSIVDFTQPAFPVALKSIFDPPLIVYVQGEVLREDALAVGIVGTRRPSLYGEQTAERLAVQLAQRGFTIVSGLARGIDTSAHRGALKAAARTIGVMGSGLDVPYPPENKDLMQEIVNNGALVSELPLGAPPDRQTFPRRNRLISGLSLGVVVVEGKENSGALITARSAVEQGREVFAVPGRVDDPRSRGPHLLIKQGAKLVETVDDVLSELGPVADLLKPHEPGGARETPQTSREAAATPPSHETRETSETPEAAPAPAVPATSAERRIMELVGEEPLSIDDIVSETGLSPQETTSHLLVLEIRRLVRRLPGNMYQKTAEAGGA